MGIEGIINKRSSHASGVIMFDEDPYEHGCFMRTPSGDVITQYDLHMCEAAGMTKYDFLVTEVQDKLVQAIKFLQEYGEIEKDLTLREVYNKYFHPSVLPIEDKDVWKNIQDVKVLDLFQFDSAVGSQAAKKIKPSSMLEMADANGLMRLMTGEDGGEQPIDKYVRFKNNISLWYDEMYKYGLTDEEIKSLKPHFLKSHGVPPSQEQLMTMLMDPAICGFSLKDANAARKIVGKKQMDKIPALHEKVLSQAKRPELGKYIWECGIGPQMGYSFSVIHALAYSFIGFQTAYIATKWNPIYWDTACLVVNSGSLEDNEEIVNIYEKEDPDYEYEDLKDRSGKKKKTTDYAKIAKAISTIKSKGIKVSLVNINTSDYGFKPDVEHNRILYGLKAVNRMSNDSIEKIIQNRPYNGIKDFIVRCPLTKTVMINLIKAGAFDEIETSFKSRQEIMIYYILKICEPKKKLNLINFNGLIQYGLIPEELEMQIRIYNFTKYLKANKKWQNYFVFDESCDMFFNRFLSNYIENLEVINGKTCILQTKWDKIYQKYMDVARDWLKDNQEEMLQKYNFVLFKDLWDKYASGNTSKWEMDSLCFYYGKHELAEVNEFKYGVVNFNDLSSEPEIDYFYERGNNKIPIYKLHRIMGTVLAKDDTRCSIILLTTTGVVNVKFTRDYYAMFKRQISQIQPDGTKKVVEKGWFTRGKMLMVTGFRREDTFVGKTYKNTEGHQLYLIEEVVGDEIKIRHDRYTGQDIIEEDYEE
jgi:DNA polymerase-3 subunit alpha